MNRSFAYGILAGALLVGGALVTMGFDQYSRTGADKMLVPVGDDGAYYYDGTALFRVKGIALKRCVESSLPTF